MIDSNKLKSIIEAEINDSLGFLETDTTDERQKALEYYLREPYGNEVDGKSTIVTGEVAEVVDEGKVEVVVVEIVVVIVKVGEVVVEIVVG